MNQKKNSNGIAIKTQKVHKKNKAVRPVVGNSKEKTPIKYQYIQKAYRNNKIDMPTVLNQFVCLECNSVNLVEELEDRKTKLCGDKDLYCRCCKNRTTQICVEYIDVTRTKLEVTQEKTPEEARTLRAILGQKVEINSSSLPEKKDTKRVRQKKKNLSARGKK